MNIFEDITLTWKGVEYRIPANRVLRAIGMVEDIITVQELMVYGEKGTAPIAKLSQAFGAVLRYAGARVSDDEVYSGMFKNDDNAAAIPVAINTLLGMMIPRDLVVSQEVKEAVGKSVNAPGKNSSKVRSKPSSAAAGFPPSNSGH